jgi:hypothetical protein
MFFILVCVHAYKQTYIHAYTCEQVTDSFNETTNPHNKGTFAASSDKQEFMRQLMCASIVAECVSNMFEQPDLSISIEVCMNIYIYVCIVPLFSVFYQSTLSASLCTPPAAILASQMGGARRSVSLFQPCTHGRAHALPRGLHRAVLRGRLRLIRGARCSQEQRVRLEECGCGARDRPTQGGEL